MDSEGVLNGLLKAVLAVAVVAAAAFAVLVLLDRMASEERAAEHRALLSRATELDRAATTPGSPLACLDAGAGETVETACEKAVFADARSVAAAVAYTAARLALVKDAHDLAQRGDATALQAFAGTRRAIELDRFGLVAQVLTQREGCTIEQCPAFAMLADNGTIKGNIKAHVFDQYVSRHAGEWDKAAPARQAEQPPVAAAPMPASAPEANAASSPPPSTGRPVDSRWDFPSAASIPPVSIMNAEPKLPKPEAAPATPAPDDGATVPVPPKRPQAQAPAPAQAR